MFILCWRGDCATVPGADSEEGSVSGASSLYHAALATVRQLSNGLNEVIYNCVQIIQQEVIYGGYILLT